MSATELITGNTFPVKEELKALGGKWDSAYKGWKVPAEKAAEARALVANAPAKAAASSGAAKPKSFSRCQVCGVAASQYQRIYGSGECKDCYEERKMGY